MLSDIRNRSAPILSGAFIAGKRGNFGRGDVWAALLLIVWLLVMTFWSVVSYGWPTPRIADEFAYLLTAQTFLEGRLTNPVPPFHESLVTQHVLLEPSYQSKYPPGIGLQLAVGLLCAGDPIVGVWLTAAACILVLHRLFRLHLSPEIATCVTIAAFSWHFAAHYFLLSYWGGSLALFSALCILLALEGYRTDSFRWGATSILLGAGWATLSLVRPFEGFLYASVSVLILVSIIWKKRRFDLFRMMPVAGTFVVVAVLFHGYYNYRVTGSPFLFPWVLYARTTGLDIPIGVWQEIQPWPSSWRDAESGAMRRLSEFASAGFSWRWSFQSLANIVMYLFPGGVSLLFMIVPLFNREWRRQLAPYLWFFLPLMVLPFATNNIRSSLIFGHYIAAWIAPAVLLVVTGAAVTGRMILGERRWLAPFLAAGLVTSSVILQSVRASILPSEGLYGLSLIDANRDARNALISALTPEPEADGGAQQIVFVKYEGLSFNYSSGFIFNGPNPFEQPVVFLRYTSERQADRVREVFADAEFWNLELQPSMSFSLSKMSGVEAPQE